MGRGALYYRKSFQNLGSRFQGVKNLGGARGEDGRKNHHCVNDWFILDHPHRTSVISAARCLYVISIGYCHQRLSRISSFLQSSNNRTHVK